jgi:hypothetical protein
MEEFNLKKLNEIESTDQYHINSASETVRENIKISAKNGV